MKKLTLLLLFFILAHQQDLKAQLPPPTGSFMSISDVHFDPFFDPGLVDSLVRSDVEQWQSIFESSSIQQPNGYGSDPNYPLFKSSLTAMKEVSQQSRFMVISGDFLCHDFQSNFARYASKYPDSLQPFITKTIRFLAGMFNSYFPEMTILPVLGNNDAFCGNYMVTPDGAFLEMFAKAWVPLQRNRFPSEDRLFIAQFSKGGYYKFLLKDGSGGNLVMLNSVFFSSGYSNSCGNPTDDPAGDQLLWLSQVLKENRLNKKRSWLVYHIPPGINVHATLRGYGNCTTNVQLMWKDSYNDQFLNLVNRYAPLIKANLAGHTHMDDFRVLYNGVKPVSFIHITPAVSPLFANNPGFQRIQYHPRTLSFINAETYYLNINKNADRWTPEYNFQQTYQVNSISAASLNTVRNRIATDSLYLNKYIQLYKVSNPMSNEINLNNWKAFWCGTGSLSRQAFIDCYCKTTP